jgi:hypothetical protein
VSNLLDHAKTELRLAGHLNTAVGEVILPLVALACVQMDQDSGGSADARISIYREAFPLLINLLRFKPISELTDDPSEWMDHEHDNPGRWQNKRAGSCFSSDGGKTYYDIDERPDYIDGVFGRRVYHSKQIEMIYGQCVSGIPGPAAEGPITEVSRPAIPHFGTTIKTMSTTRYKRGELLETLTDSDLIDGAKNNVALANISGLLRSVKLTQKDADNLQLMIKQRIRE